MFRHLTALFSKFGKNKSGSLSAVASKRNKGLRLNLEQLEDRLVPSSVPLHVAGNQLQDPANHTVVLRGVNISGLESYPTGLTGDANQVLRSVEVALNDWHANLLRLTVYPEFWFGHNQGVNLGEAADGGAAYRALVNQIIGKANAANAYVMLAVWGSNRDIQGAAPALHAMPDSGTTKFWNDATVGAAKLYANNATVLFDPFNEPHRNWGPGDSDVTWAQWRNGGQISDEGRTYTSPGMQGLLNAIRGTGANNIVSPQGLGWGSDLSGVAQGFGLTDPAGSLMYQFHFYPIHWQNAADGDAKFAPVAAYPIYLGEFGTPRDANGAGADVNGVPQPNAPTWTGNMISWLNQHQYSWTAWSFAPNTPPSLISDWNYTPTDYFGIYVKNALSMGQAPSSSVPTNPVNYTPNTVFKLGNYWIHVPASYDATHQTPTELFVWSHGWGGQSQWDIYNVASTAGGPSYITIALDGRELSGWDMNTDPAKVLAGIADVKTHFNIDPRRVVLGGYSSGGDLSYRVAFTNSTEIAGVLAENTAPFSDTGLTQNQALAAPFHFNVVHLAHTGDSTYPIANVRSETGAVKAAGAAGDGWASLQFIERSGTHWDNDNGNTGTVYDLKTFLLPHLGDGWTSSPLAQGPINNTFANRTVINGASATVSGTNVNATKEASEPNHAGNAGGKSVWWTWTAPASGSVTINTAGSNFDTTLGVYPGASVSGLTVVASNDDANNAAGIKTSVVTFNAVAGVAYQIAVDGYDGASGNITVNVALTPTGPVNNNFANRTVISGSSATVSGTNVNATKEASEPNHASNTGGKSAWWTWTAPASGSVTINTAGSNFDTTLGVYTGSSVSALTVVAGNDDANNAAGVKTSTVTFNAVAGVAYQIAVDGYNGASGNITVNVALTPTGPANNNFANRTVISGSSATVSGTNVNATKEASEPNHANNAGGKSDWWTWTAPASGSVTINTAGSNFDTTLGVYTGTSVSGLTVVASNDDANNAAGIKTSTVTFNAVAGVAYQIAVDGYNGASGNITVNVALTPAGPANNNFAGRSAISGLSATVSGTNVNATKEASEPNHAGNTGGKSVWWTWTAPVAGSVTIKTAGSNFDTTLGIYIGSSVSAPTLVASNDDANNAAGIKTSVVTFNAVAGVAYQIAVDGYNGASGNITLNVVLTPVGPANNFASRTMISGSSLTVTGTNVNATKEAGEPNHAGNTGGKSVWWTWTAPTSGSVTIDTAGSNFDTTLGVYKGSAVSALTLVASNDDANNAAGVKTSVVTFNAVAGVTYQIAVDGYNGASGNITLNLRYV